MVSFQFATGCQTSGPSICLNSSIPPQSDHLWSTSLKAGAPDSFCVSRKTILNSLASIALLAIYSSLSLCAEIQLAENGKALCTIFHSENKVEQKAAAQLGEYLKKITGDQFQVSLVGDQLPEAGIFVGRLDDTELNLKEEDGFTIRTEGRRLFIRGGSPTGTMYGVYGFLDEVLGCRWWSHTEEDVPSKPSLKLGDLNIKREPVFAMHHLMNLEAQSNTNDFRYKGRGTGRQGFTGSHNMYKLVAAYGKEHPEIYPQDKDGKRKPNNLHLCYLAPNLPEALAEVLSEQVEARKGNVKNAIFFAGMGDWYGGQCLCDDCQAVYKEETWTDPDGRQKPGYTGTLLRMINKTGEILDAKYPGILVGTFAYMSLEAPPLQIRPGKNVTIRVPRLRHCTVHSARTCPKNGSFKRNLERWCEIAPGRVYVWDYGTNYKSFVFPFPCVRSISDNIKLYHEMGIRGLMIQGNYVTTGSDLVILKNYVWSKLMWNPDLKTEDLTREFCDGYYGPASSTLQEYINELENSVREPELIHADEFAENASYLKQPYRERLAALRIKAIEATQGQQPWRQRIGEATVGIEALTLAGHGMRKVGGKTVLQDGMYLWSILPQYSFPRAFSVVEHLRSSGVNEWTTGLSYWLAFLNTHSVFGASLSTLKSKDLRIEIAPEAGGQLRQIHWKGQPVFAVTDASTDTAGGSVLKFGKGFGSATESNSEAEIHMLDGLQIPQWRWSSKYVPTVWKKISLSGDSVLMTAGTKPKVNPQKGSVVTVYSAGDEPDQLRIEHQAPGKADWQSVEISATSSETVLQTVGALRVHLKAQKCVVEDQYLSPRNEGCRITFDKLRKLVTITVLTMPIGKTEVTEESALLELPEENAAFLRVLKIVPK